MNNENLQYLADNIKYMGFGENHKTELEKSMAEGKAEFQLVHRAEINKKPFEATMNFRKSDSTDMYFFNNYHASLEKNNGVKMEQTFYLNHIRGEYQYEDYFFKELIPHVEKTYRIHAEKRFRSIAGLSMGGFGSLLYSLHHPELFNTCYAMSAAVRTDEQINQMPLPEFQRRYKTALGDIKESDKRITEFWNQNSILFLTKNLPEDKKKSVRFYLDCGDDDNGLYAGNGILHNLMRDLNIPHEYRVRDGGHTWEYWRTGLPEALRFISLGMR